MKKIIISLLSMTMLLSTSFSLTSCDSDDVEAVVEVASTVINALLGNNNSTASIDGTAWVQLDDNNNGVALAFKGGNQGLWYTIKNNDITDIQQFGYSYDSSTNTLSIGSTQFTVEAFTANQTLTLKSGNDTYTFQYYDISKLPDPSQQGSDMLAGTAWYIGLQSGGYLLYDFSTATAGVLYQLDEAGENIVAQVKFTYTLNATTALLTISYEDGDSEQWTVVGTNDNGQLILKDANGNQYAFNRYTSSN